MRPVGSRVPTWIRTFGAHGAEMSDKVSVVVAWAGDTSLVGGLTCIDLQEKHFPEFHPRLIRYSTGIETAVYLGQMSPVLS